ncbi:hypothetical protein [Arthrobacter sunyaminii]|uniref:hypothetical protein n=1 Tax=Arthrobacter sunyaminii TaxID=2816859 RepID=UPI001A94C7B3|nr:hypothetical protein [Arthrobacter sunyaminii]MBO0898336.1 hypothetical protein [Arthrobacter sunyaminii]
MEATPLIIIAILGLCLGVLLATVRIPEIRWVPFLSLILLTVGAVLAIQRIWEVNILGGLVLLLGTLLGSFFYSGKLWQRLDLEPGVSYLQWAQRDLLHQGYLRGLYRTERAEPLAPADSEASRQPML